MAKLATPQFLAELKELYPSKISSAQDYVENPWYMVAAVAFCGSNEPEEVPHVFNYALKELEDLGGNDDQRLQLARKVRDAIFKAGMTAGYPKAINSLAELSKVMPKELHDTKPMRNLKMPIQEHEEMGRMFFNTVYGSTAESVQGLLDSIYPDMGWFSNTIAYGLTYSFMGAMTPIEFSYTLVATLITNDNPRQIQWHLDGARRNGATFEETKAVREIAMRIGQVVGVRWKSGVPDVKDVVL